MLHQGRPHVWHFGIWSTLIWSFQLFRALNLIGYPQCPFRRHSQPSESACRFDLYHCQGTNLVTTKWEQPLQQRPFSAYRIQPMLLSPNALVSHIGFPKSFSLTRDGANTDSYTVLWRWHHTSCCEIMWSPLRLNPVTLHRLPVSSVIWCDVEVLFVWRAKS